MHIALMDFIRGVSALLVMLGHLRNAYFVPYNQVQHPSIFDHFFYFITGFGHQAVIVFFVLSGYFVGGEVIKNKNTFNFTAYLSKRLSRLWTVLVPALLFTIIIDNYLNFETYYSFINININSLPQKSEYSDDTLTFLGNLFFLQGVLVPTLGTNGPLWSLTYEFWYYILFPMSLILIGKIKTQFFQTRILNGAFMAILIWILPFKIILLFFVWLMGALVYLIHKKYFWRPTKLYLSSVIFFLSLFFTRLSGFNSEIANDFLVGFSFSFLCIFASKAQQSQSHKKLFSNISAFISKISYTLYLFHFPIVVSIILFYEGKQAHPNMNSYLTYFLLSTVIFLFSFLMWGLFERNTSKIRNIINKIIKAH